MRMEKKVGEMEEGENACVKHEGVPRWKSVSTL